MDKIIEIPPGDSPTVATADSPIHPVDPGVMKRDAPTAHYCMVRDSHLVARCSIWTESTPIYESKFIGVIGHYAAADAPAGVAILNHAAGELTRKGFVKIVGPMDGNTWRRYRLLTDRGSEPLFFLEPDNPDDWSAHFESAGFTPLARYFSALNSDLSVVDSRVPEAVSRLQEAGVEIRNIDLSRFEDELKAVHELSLESFADNFLYTPISQAEFLGMYAPIRPHMRPELILLAEKEGQLIGFMFGLPDLKQAERREPVTTAVAKSMAVRPGRTGGGLGSVLMDQFQQAARQLGFTRVIHALMHENNHSLRISSRFGKPIRQYTLFARESGR